jgi:hypothetical protein
MLDDDGIVMVTEAIPCALDVFVKRVPLAARSTPTRSESLASPDIPIRALLPLFDIEGIIMHLVPGVTFDRANVVGAPSTSP